MCKEKTEELEIDSLYRIIDTQTYSLGLHPGHTSAVSFAQAEFRTVSKHRTRSELPQTVVAENFVLRSDIASNRLIRRLRAVNYIVSLLPVL